MAPMVRGGETAGEHVIYSDHAGRAVLRAILKL